MVELTTGTVIGIAIQNNSGGYFIENEDVGYLVAVEGFDKKDVSRRFDEIVRPYGEFCSCCGPRWDGIEFTGWSDPEEEITLENFQEISDENEVYCVLHFINGTKKRCVYEGGVENDNITRMGEVVG